MLRIGQAPAVGRVVEGDPEAQVARGRDRRRNAEQLRDAARQIVGPPVAAQERHDRAAVLGHGDDRRLGALVAEQGGQRTHQHPGGADPYDRPAGLEQLAQVRRGFGKHHLGGLGPAGQAVHLGAAQIGRQAVGQVEPAPGQHHEHRPPGRIQAHLQASPRLCTRIMEK